MNTKKKHKNRPKPSPNVLAKLETEVKEEKVEDVLPKSDVKEEIPSVAAVEVTAVADEVISQVLENVEAESETPKKPKRKGKKKNQDKENVEEETEKVQEIGQSEAPKPEKQVTSQGESKEQDDSKPTEAASVTPSARKKKNKKKSQEPVSQPSKVSEEESLLIPVEEKEEEIQKVEPEVKDTVPLKAEDTKPETKSKKKNKKKKRNDSERSDRSEEISCTSAFQQLLIEADKPVEESEIKEEDTQTKEDVAPTTILESIILSDIPKSCDVEVKVDILSVQKPTDETVEAPKEESKNKKKNKKDKKHSHEETQKEDVPTSQNETEPQTTQIIELIGPSKPEIVKEPSPKPTLEAISETKQVTELLEPSKGEIKREPSPKPKAKIAKPVEKKRKGQQDLPAMEKTSENLTVMKEEIVFQERSATPVEIIESKIAPEEIPKEIETQDVLKIVDTMNVPSKAQDKKRKKSPKPQKCKEIIDVKEEALLQVEETKTEPPTEASEEKTESGIENVTFTMCDEPFIPLQKSEKIEIVSPVDEVPPLLKIDELNIPDNRGGKRKKKTPKFPVTTKDIKQLITPEITESKDEPPKTEKVSESLSALLSDVEIQSVKTDDSGSSCDATPDVHFIRSSSHQILDTNNNTVIQEVRNVGELQTNIPFIKPMIEGSGETPSQTPDLVLPVLGKSESKTTGKEEPTFLKSKMMEVNQDMEELRLSIERSLAEFSAMEKTEQKAEEDYEPHRVECEKTFADIEVKKPEEQTSLPVEFDNKASKPNIADAPPVCPARKDNKGKGKSKKKGKQETTPAASSASTAQSETTSSSKDDTKDKQEKQEKTEQKTESTEKGKQQSTDKTKQADDIEENPNSNTETYQTVITEESNKLSILEQTFADSLEQLDFAPIDKFEDALTSSIDDVNRSFEMIVNENAVESLKNLAANKPEINITAPVDEAGTSKKETNKRDDKVNPVSQPKNFLGHNDIPVQSNRLDYKKEKNKTPNERQAKVKIKDAMDVEAKKQSKESQTDIKKIKKMVDVSEKETFSRVKNDNEEYVYKYSFRKVFLQSACHICHKELVQRVPCGYCNLVFYCGAKHKDEDWAQHQALCFAVSTIVHLKDQKHIYADAQNITGQEYRLLRMQMIVSCEKVLKRRLVPWEQEAMLYPRMCGDVGCREWRQAKLKDCEGCGQISYCSDNPAHLPKSHQRWCKSYHLYSKLVSYQQTRGRLEPRLPTKVMVDSQLLEKMNEVLAAMYEEKIDMNDIQYAALTQLATAPLTAAHCYQLCMSKLANCNGLQKKTSFTIHVVGAELQFEADALNKWEVFFLHLRPDVEELRVVLISPVLNPGELPLDLLGKIKLCDHCRQNKRRVVFSFQDKMNYSEYRASDEFVTPKLVCAFNPSIQRSSVYNGKDPWPNTINSIIKQKVPFIITGYTLSELRKDIARIKECSEIDFKVISEPVFNNFASVRPDRNFISDDEMPLLFKNYCVSVLCGC